MKKIRKFLKTPHLFFRDYLNKKYPVKNIEQPYVEDEEAFIVRSSNKLPRLASKNSSDYLQIDVVFTWVDSSDVAWQHRYKQHTQHIDNMALYADDPARFENHNELYYSVHSVLNYMPWVRNVYIVTDAQIPAWLVKKPNEKIHIIDHCQIIDDVYLPTFNSHVIEAFLYKIPNLSENFIYFNDDVFVARELPMEHFFQKNGIASIFIANKSLEKMRNNGLITPTLSASKKSIDLINRYYRTKIDMPLVHTYIPLKKSIYKLAWELYSDQIKSFLPNRLRTNNDLNFANFLVPWLMYFEGKAMPRPEICYYFNIRSAHALAQYKKLLAKKAKGEEPHSFCANDFHSSNSISNYQERLLDMLSNYYSGFINT